jgi:hypothetical protein
MMGKTKLWRDSRRLSHLVSLSAGYTPVDYRCGLQDFDGSFSRTALAKFEYNELSDQIFEFSRKRLRQDRQTVGVQLATDRRH